MAAWMSFRENLTADGLELRRRTPSTLQINVGLLCNLACKHCHLEAGPHRDECMDADTVEAVIAYATAHRFEVVDITGGAPEMNPHLTRLVEGLVPLADTVMLRSNLVAMAGEDRRQLMTLLARHGVVVVASLPSTRKTGVDKVRGAHTYDAAIPVLQALNALGYGQVGSGLELHLVTNPGGAFLPADQEAMERRYRKELERACGVVFNRVLALPNAPLGRFRRWLESSGNLDDYMTTLAKAFNPAALENVMCREVVSVAWDGALYDCDFNQAARLPMTGRPTVRDATLPPADQTIAVGDHCYACTAGCGFT